MHAVNFRSKSENVAQENNLTNLEHNSYFRDTKYMYIEIKSYSKSKTFMLKNRNNPKLSVLGSSSPKVDFSL